MSRFACLPGGRDEQPYAAHTVRPVRRTETDQQLVDRGITAIRNLRPLYPPRLDPLAVRPVFLTAFEAELAKNALRASTSQAVRDLGDEIAAQFARADHPSMGDWTPPHGIDRPVS